MALSSDCDLLTATRQKNLRRTEASCYLREVYGIPCAPATLNKMASTGGGPRYHKVNRTALYPVAELDAWAMEKLGPLHSSSSNHAHGSSGIGD